MTKNRIGLFLVVFISAIVLTCAYSNCSSMNSNSTVTGNPLSPRNAAQLVAHALCQQISTCAPTSSPISVSDCYTNIQPVTNIVSLLGASATTYPTFGDLINANLAGTILGNTTTGTSSVTQILGESCSSAAIQNIYTGGGPDYTNVAAMVPASSSTIFATPIYRSVGPTNTSVLACGGADGSGCASVGGALTISVSGAATFASALPNVVGVGDVVVYDCSGNSSLGAGDCVAFVQGGSRISGTQMTLQNAAGGTPTTYTGTVWRIYRAYTSVANAIAGGTSENSAIVAINAALGEFDSGFNGNNNLVTGNTQWNIALYGDADDIYSGVILTIGGWTTSTSNNIRVYAPFASSDVGVSQRHSGTWTAGAATISFPAAYFVQINVSNFILDGIQFTEVSSPGGGDFTIMPWNAGHSNIYITNNILNGTGSTGNFGGIANQNDVTNLVIANNIIYNYPNHGISVGGGSIYVYNNTVVNSGTYGLYASEPGTVSVKNNLITGSGTADYNPGSASKYMAAADNLSGDASSPNTALRSKTVTFVNAAASDYLLSVSDTAAKGAGTDLSSDANYSFDTDITGVVRTDPWDVGASTPH